MTENDRQISPPEMIRDAANAWVPLLPLQFFEDARDRADEQLRKAEDEYRDAHLSPEPMRPTLWPEMVHLPELSQAIQDCIDAFYPGSRHSTQFWNGFAESDMTFTCYTLGLAQAERTLQDEPEPALAHDR